MDVKDRRVKKGEGGERDGMIDGGREGGREGGRWMLEVRRRREGK